MDFLSRDRYRQAVEELAEPTGEAQLRVALRAVESARQAAESGQAGGSAPPTSATTSSARAAATSRPTSPIAPGFGRRARRFALRPRDRRLPRIDRARDRRCCSSLGLAYLHGQGASPLGVGLRPALLLLLPASEVGDRARAAPGRPLGAAAAPPPPRLRRRHPRERADHGGRAHAAHERARGASAASSTSRCWRSATSTRASTSRSSATSSTRPRARCRRTRRSSTPPGRGSRP